jgi:hypothetical protein
MASVDFTGAVWRKSSYSGGETNDDCLEMAWSVDGSHVAYRDSKDPTMSMLVITAEAHRRFIEWAPRAFPPA